MRLILSGRLVKVLGKSNCCADETQGSRTDSSLREAGVSDSEGGRTTPHKQPRDHLQEPLLVLTLKHVV